MSVTQPNFHLPVVVIGNEVPDELHDCCINWYFCYKEDVDELDLNKYAAVIVSGFFNVGDRFILKLKEMVMANKLGVILRKNESFSNKMGFTRGQVRHFHNFSKTTCRLHNRIEHEIVTKYAFYTMNMDSIDFSYCYYLSLNNLVDDKEIVQLDSSAYGYTMAVHRNAPLIYHFFEYEKRTSRYNKFLMFSCLKWISERVRAHVISSLRGFQRDPNFTLVETCQKHSDIRFVVEERPLWANRQLLAYRSSYFDAMLFGPMLESGQDEIVLDDISYDTMRTILMFFVSGEAKIDDDNVCDVLVHCDKFGDLEPLKDRCTEYLVNHLVEYGRVKYSLDDIWHLVVLGSRHRLQKILQVCAHWIVSNQLFFRDKLKNLDPGNPVFYWCTQIFLDLPHSGVVGITHSQ